jgi:hypothetical protein
MKIKNYKDGCRSSLTEYEVREIDQYGDCQDIDHHDTQAEAMQRAKAKIAAGVLAVAVERHISRRPAHMFGEPDTFTTLAVMGDKAALELWGWQPGESTWLEN